MNEITTPSIQNATMIDPNIINPLSRWSIKKILFLLALGITALVLITAVFFPQIFLFLTFKTLFSGNQSNILSVIPQNKTIIGLTQTSQKPVYALNKLSFQTDWKLEKDLLAKDGLSHIYKFDTGRAIIVSQVPKLSDITKELSPDKYNKLVSVLGSQTLNSEYEFFSRVFRTTGTDIGITSKPETITANTVFLTLKKTLLLNEKSEIFSFSINGLKGFEIHSLDSKNTRIYFFDQSNSVYNMVLIGDSISQVDIDSIISSTTISN